MSKILLIISCILFLFLVGCVTPLVNVDDIKVDSKSDWQHLMVCSINLCDFSAFNVTRDNQGACCIDGWLYKLRVYVDGEEQNLTRG